MVILIHKVVAGCDTNAQGAVVRKMLAAKIQDGNPVSLDFSNIFNVTSSFVNTAFIDLLEDLGVDKFKKLVLFKNVNRQIGMLIKSRVSAVAGKPTLAA